MQGGLFKALATPLHATDRHLAVGLSMLALDIGATVKAHHHHPDHSGHGSYRNRSHKHHTSPLEAVAVARLGRVPETPCSAHLALSAGTSSCSSEDGGSADVEPSAKAFAVGCAKKQATRLRIGLRKVPAVVKCAKAAAAEDKPKAAEEKAA